MKNMAFISMLAGLALVNLPGAVLASYSPIPFVENFDSYPNGTPLINGTNGWVSSSSNVVVQANVFASGTQAARVPIDCTLSNQFTNNTYTSAWIQTDTRIVFHDTVTAVPVEDTNVAALFFVSNGYFVVHNGPATTTTNWVVLTNLVTGGAVTPVTETNWTRIDLHHDYTNKTWDLFVNYVLITNNIGFVNANLSALNSLGCYNGNSATTYMDNVWAMTTNPPDLAQNGNNWLPYIVGSSSALASAIMEGNHSSTQTFDIWKTGYYGLWFTNTASGLSGGQNWLTLAPATNTSTGNHAQVTGTFGAAGLSPGIYTGLVSVAGQDTTFGYQAGNSPTNMSVTLTVEAMPIISLSSESQSLNQIIPKGQNPTNMTFSIWNGSGAPIVPMTYRLAISNDAASWLSFNFTNGTSVGEHDTVTVTFGDMSGYAAGTYTGKFSVSAFDSGTGYTPVGSLTQTVERTVTVQIMVPDAPAGIWASDGTDTTRVFIHWTPSTGMMSAASYELRRNTTFDVDYASTIADLTGTNYEDTSASPGVLYYYWVRPVNEVGIVGVMSAYDTGYRALSPPDGVLATDGSYTNQVVVTWSAVRDASSYEVYRAFNSDPTAGSVVYFTDGLQYNDVQVSDGVRYWYQVRSVKGSIVSALSAGDVGYVLSTPTGLSATKGVYTTHVRTSWNPVDGATGYEVWRNTVALSQSSAKVGDAASVAYDDTSVLKGTMYYYWVKAKSAVATGNFSGSDNGYAATGSVALAVWNLAVLPPVLPAGSHPVIASFRMQNNGPSALMSPNTALAMSFYMGRTPDINQAASVGSTLQDIWLAAGMAAVVKVSGLSGITMPSEAGDYYVFVHAAPVWPNLLADESQGNNVTMGVGLIHVTASGSPHYWGVNDYDGDGLSDLAVCDRSKGTWSVETPDGEVLGENVPFGGASFIPAVGDYDGDRKADPAIYDTGNGLWSVMISGSGYVTVSAKVGESGCVAMPGDYDGDGKADPVVYQESSGYWAGLLSASGYAQAAGQFGAPGYRPVPGDYNGDGIWDLALYNEATGYWFILTPGGELLKWAEYWGSPGYQAVSGDYDGDGVWDLAVYSESTGYWYIRTMSGAILAAGTYWGSPGYIPVPGDYNGDGIWDLAVYRSSSGYWYALSPAGQILLYDNKWGSSAATPVKW